MVIRNAVEADYIKVISVINDWWGGRQMADMLPRLFFKHFGETSFIVEENGEMLGFLVGFISPAYPKEAYVHFLGVNPHYRRQGIGRRLYQHFDNQVKEKGVDTVHLVTSIVNKTSIAYHTKVGFSIDEGDCVVDGVQVHTDYDGIGSKMVVFTKQI